jgi:hypothetical protein
MDAKQSIRSSLAHADMIVDAYLADLAPKEMLARAVPGSNHIAWQLGHLISSERYIIDKALPGSLPPLPAGFDDRHSDAKAASDDPSSFLSKDEYRRIARDVRASVLALLDSLSPADLDRPVTGGLPPTVKTVGDAFLFLGPHWLMHAGQWAVLRRSLGRKPLF